MDKKNIVYNQNIFNACVWAYGTINNIVDFVFENGLKFDSVIEQGTEVVFDSTKGSIPIKNYLTRNNLIPISNMQEDEGVDFAWLWSDNQNDVTLFSDSQNDVGTYR